ncbi:MAG: hypothetical protein U1E53_15905 [Dongiaceae bacterium]
MPEVSMQNLRAWAGRDLELRAVAEDGQATVRAGERNFGGRLARNLKIGLLNEDRGAKQAQYRDAKDAVLAALKREYGEAIGLKAFRAAVGRARADGGWETSADHPLTGRQIERMLSVADRERDRTAPVRRLLGDDGPLRLERIEGTGPRGRMSPGEALGSVLADLDREIQAWREAGGEGRPVWAVEVGLAGSEAPTLIAIRPGEDGMLQVLGPGGEVATASREDLGRLLVNEHLGGPVRSLSLLRAGAGTLADWVGEARNLPPEARGFEARDIGARDLEAGNAGRFVARRIAEDVEQWQGSVHGRLGVTDEFYAIEIEPPPDRIGRPATLAIRVAGDWSHPAYGREENPSVGVEVRDSDGRIVAMPLDGLAAWLDARLAGERGTLRLGKETPCPHLAPHFTALARARNSAPNVAAMDDADRLLRRAERVESIARSRIDRHGVELAILELEALRRGEPDGEVLASREGWGESLEDGTAGRAARWQDLPDLLQLFDAAEDAIDAEIGAQIARLQAILQALPPEPGPSLEIEVDAGPGKPPPGVLRSPGDGRADETARRRVVVEPPPPRLERLEGEPGWRLPPRKTVPTSRLDQTRRDEIDAIRKQLSQELATDSAGVGREGVSQRLAGRAGTVPLRISVGGAPVPPGMEGGLDGPALLDRLGGLAGLGGEPTRQAGLTRFLDDSRFEAVWRDAVERLGLDDGHPYEVAIEVEARGEGYAVTFRAPLPGPLDYRLARHSGDAEGRIEAPVLAMTVEITARQLTEPMPYPLVALHILDGR